MDLPKQFHSHELAGLPTIDDSLLHKAINLFANNKSCANDTIVSEMLNAFDEDVLEMLAEAFIKRILNTESEFIWKNKEEDDAHVIRYEYDPRPDKLDSYEPKRKRELATDTNEDQRWGLEDGRWQKRCRRDVWVGERSE